MANSKIIKSLGKINPHIDFDPKEFDKEVLSNGGRCYWSRALECPLRLNHQTTQASPDCDMCGGAGYIHVKPSDGVRLDVYDDCCEPFNDRDDALATQVIVQSATKDPQMYEKLGEWVFGTVRVTPFSFNRLDFKDRLEMVDTTMSYRQIVVVPEDRFLRHDPLRKDPERFLRYKAVDVREAFLVTKTSKTSIRDLTRVHPDGAIEFKDPTIPAVGTLVSLSYSFRPILIVLDHVYAWRDMLETLKSTSKVGVNKPMPTHAMARLEFIDNP